MIPYKQLLQDDCLRAAIGSIIEVDPIRIPHFVNGANGDTIQLLRDVNEYLRDLKPAWIAVPVFWWGTLLGLRNDHRDTFGPHYHYIVVGMTQFKGIHAWVYRGKELVHNPSKFEHRSKYPQPIDWGSMSEDMNFDFLVLHLNLRQPC